MFSDTVYRWSVSLIVTVLASFLIILAVTALVRGLRLGVVRLENKQQACAWAEKNIPFFKADKAILSEDGQAALVCDSDDRVVILKRHGSKFAARLLPRPIEAKQDGPVWNIESGDRQFGRVRMQFDLASQNHLLTLL